MKKKRKYTPPKVVVVPVELEMLICQSGLKLYPQADEIHHINADEDADEADFYFEF